MQNKPDGLNSVIGSFNATTGWNFDMNEALEAGHRSAILQSLFETQRGWIAEQDWTNVGPRFLEPIPDGKFKGFTIAKWLPGMVMTTIACPADMRKRGVHSWTPWRS